MSPGVRVLRALLFLLDVGGAQVLATGKSAGAEIDFKYALIGTVLGVAISVGFLALKICMIRKHLSGQDSADLRNTAPGVTGSLELERQPWPPQAEAIKLAQHLSP
ncbi:transmembrane protein 273 [Erethizon dorsatum]